MADVPLGVQFIGGKKNEDDLQEVNDDDGPF